MAFSRDTHTAVVVGSGPNGLAAAVLLARAGVRDMLRLSDCRMSGTAFGTVVLHIAPEAAAGGALLPLHRHPFDVQVVGTGVRARGSEGRLAGQDE